VRILLCFASMVHFSFSLTFFPGFFVPPPFLSPVFLPHYCVQVSLSQDQTAIRKYRQVVIPALYPLLCYSMLCYSMLCAMLYSALLLYALLLYALCYAILCSATLCCAVLCNAVIGLSVGSTSSLHPAPSHPDPA
jgi:hypothetical protein